MGKEVSENGTGLDSKHCFWDSGKEIREYRLETSLLLALILSWAIYNFGPQNPRFVCMESHKLKDELVFISTKYFYAYVPPKSLVVNLYHLCGCFLRRECLGLRM